jgi:hypothetical protein
VILKASPAFRNKFYLWQDGSTDSVFHVNTKGTYFVRVTNNIGCVTLDTIRVTELLADVGVNQLIAPVSACELGSQVPVWITIKGTGTDIVDVNDTSLFSEINSNLLKDTL